MLSWIYLFSGLLDIWSTDKKRYLIKEIRKTDEIVIFTQYFMYTKIFI